jgi:hypothetical protein
VRFQNPNVKKKMRPRWRRRGFAINRADMTDQEHAEVVCFLDENPDNLSFIVEQVTDRECQMKALVTLQEVLRIMLRVYPGWLPGEHVLQPLGFTSLFLDSGLLSPN